MSLYISILIDRNFHIEMEYYKIHIPPSLIYIRIMLYAAFI